MTTDETDQQADRTDQQVDSPDQPASDADQRTTFTLSRTFRFGKQPPSDAGVTIVPGRERRFEWTWSPPGADSEDTLEEEPVTYYEALTGQRDTLRDFFINARRMLKLISWILVLGLPALIVAVAVATGQTPETIVVMGIGALIVGLMFQRTLPRTPFD